MSRFVSRFTRWALALALLTGPLVAQSVVTGQIEGRITDSTGSALPGVLVEGRNQETGFNRNAYTDSEGNYSLTLIPPGIYEVKASLSGFNDGLRRDLRVAIGQTVKIDFGLQMATVTEEIVVTAAAPVVETASADIAQVINQNEIENLPLNGRDFKDLVLLTPGALDAGDGRASVAGNRGINNSFNIDGADSNSSFFGEERGGTRPAFTFSQAAIREFRVISSAYDAQFGNATGGIVNAITKSGTNDFRGEVFYFFRDDSFVEKDANGFEPRAFDQQQGGITVGGPVVRDRIHYFAGYDGQRKEDETFRRFNDPQNLLQVPENRARLESLLGYSLEEELGNVIQTDDMDVLLIKLDSQINQNNLLTVRDNYSRYQGENQTSSFQTDGRSTNGLEENEFNSLVGSLNSVLTSNSFNELIAQYTNEERPRTNNSSRLPEVVIGNFDAVFGQNNFLPNDLKETRLQLLDNFSWLLDRHTVKAGIDYSQVEYDDLFFRFQAGSYAFSSWADFFANRPRQYQQAFSPVGGKAVFDVDYINAYVQDEWKATPKLTLNYGVRYELQQNPDGVRNPNFPQTGEIPDDTDNFAPRLGLAYDVGADGKSVIRAGLGRFFNTTPTLLLANALLTNGVTVTRVTLTRSSSGALPAGFPTFPDRIPSLGSLPTVRPDLFVVEPDFENPETWRASVGYEREIATNFSAGIDLVYSEGENFERRWDINLFPAQETTADGRPKYQTQTRPISGFGRIIQFTSDAESEYAAAILSLRKRFSNDWSLTANYTYSEFKDHDTNERNVSSSGNVPMDMFDIDSSWGWSDYDVRHNLVVSTTVVLPWQIRASMIGNYRSGRPFTALDARDLNGDSMFVDRPTIDGKILERNSFRQPDYQNIDLRLSKEFTFGGGLGIELIAEGFNITNEENRITTRTQLVNSSGAIRTDFGNPNVAGRPRQYQAGAKINF